MDSSQFSLSSVMPYDKYKEIMERASGNFLSRLDKEDAKKILGGINELFIIENSVNRSKKPLRNRGLLVKQPTLNLPVAESNLYEQPFLKEVEPGIFEMDTYTMNGRTVTMDIDSSHMKSLIKNNEDTLFLMKTSQLYTYVNQYITPDEEQQAIFDYRVATDRLKATGKKIVVNVNNFGGKKVAKVEPSTANIPGVETTKVVANPKIISDGDLAAFKMEVDKNKGTLPKTFFTNNNMTKWLLNSKNLYDLVDKVTGEIYLRDTNLETGISEAPLPAIKTAPAVPATTQPVSTTETARTIYAKLGNKTQSKNVILPKDVDPEADDIGMTYTTAIDFWRKIVPEAVALYGRSKEPLIVAFRGNAKKSFLQNYNSGTHTIGNPFDWRVENGTRDEQGIKSTKRFIHWMITGDNMGNTQATPEYRQAIINDIKSGKLKGSSILYYQEKDYATHATALDYLINEYDWNKPAQPQTTVSSDKVVEGDIFALPGIPVITTNLGGVHGAGLAQAAKAKGLVKQGDGDFKATDDVVQLPVKKKWSDNMSMNNNMELLKESLRSLIKVSKQNPNNTYLLPLAGLGHGEGSIEDILPLLIKTVQASPNIKLVIPAEGVNLGRQGTVRKDYTRENMPQIKAMLSEAGLYTTQPAAVEKTPQPGDVVSYNEKPYLLWNINAAGKAQLTDPEGAKFSGTPEMNKLSYVKTLPKVEFNNKMFVVDSKNRIFSLSSGNEVYKKAAERSKILDKLKSSTAQPSPKASNVKVISEDYGVVQVETNPTEEKTQEFVNLIAPQIKAQTYKENKGQKANEMFHYGLMWARNNPKAKPVKIKKFEGANNNYYNYHSLDQKGNPLPSIKVLQPIIDEIQKSLGIDMSDYDSVIGNIYLDNQYVYPHKDTTESITARNYPVVVYTIGNNSGLGIVDNNEGAMTFANSYDTVYLPSGDKLKGYTNEILTKNGTIYTFGMDGKGRFELTHSTPTNSKKTGIYPAITLPNGDVVTNYTITLTFRRAADLEPGMPTAPAKLTTQPAVQPTTTDVEPDIVNKKQELLKKINKAVRETNLTELLAEKGYDVTDIISNLQAATTQEDINKINKILDKLC
jgi:hypothetical protein